MKEATERNVDLIVLGSAPRWRRQSRFFSPTVEYAAQRALRGARRRLPESVLAEEATWASRGSYLRAMKAVVIGCGRVGSSSAKALQAEGWDVCAVDEKEEALQRLGESWSGGFVVGHGMDSDVLRAAGIEDADAVIVATDGDNTNLVVAQIAQKRFGGQRRRARARSWPCDVLRHARPAHDLSDVEGDSRADRGRAHVRGGPCLMYIIVVGGGKVGANLMRSLIAMGHEVTLIEQRRDRFERLEQEFEHQVLAGDGTEIFVLEQAGIARPPDILVAATGDDEDNIIICQLAREKYGVPKVVARVNDPRNQEHFDLLGIARRSARRRACSRSSCTRFRSTVHLVELRKENLEIVEVQIDGARPASARSSRVKLPEGARLIAVVRVTARLASATETSCSRAETRCWACSSRDGRKSYVTHCSGASSRAVAGCRSGGRRGEHERQQLSIVRVARGFDAPVRGRHAVRAGAPLHRRATGPDLRAREGQAAPLHGHSRPRRLRRVGAGAALDGVSPELREEPPFLRQLHRSGRRHAVVEFPSGGRRALLGTARQLLFVDQPFSNHNGGQVQFGPTGSSTSAWGTAGRR